MLDRPEEYEKMDLVEKELWWYRILHEQTLAIIQKKYKTRNIQILDAACGTGGLIDYLQGNGFENIKGFDLSAEAVKRSRLKTKADIIVLDLKQVLLNYQAYSFDVVVCHDALYFIEDKDFPDVLNSLWGLLKPNGQLILNLPSGNWFRGTHDRTVGIKKRWNFIKIKKMIALSEIKYSSIDHWNWPFLLSPVILTIRLFQRIKLGLFPNAVVTSDVEMPRPVLNRIFYELTKWELSLPFKRNFGSSVYIVIHR